MGFIDRAKWCAKNPRDCAGAGVERAHEVTSQVTERVAESRPGQAVRSFGHRVAESRPVQSVANAGGRVSWCARNPGQCATQIRGAASQTTGRATWCATHPRQCAGKARVYAGERISSFHHRGSSQPYHRQFNPMSDSTVPSRRFIGRRRGSFAVRVDRPQGKKPSPDERVGGLLKVNAGGTRQATTGVVAEKAARRERVAMRDTPSDIAGPNNNTPPSTDDRDLEAAAAKLGVDPNVIREARKMRASRAQAEPASPSPPIQMGSGPVERAPAPQPQPQPKQSADTQLGNMMGNTKKPAPSWNENPWSQYYQGPETKKAPSTPTPVQKGQELVPISSVKGANGSSSGSSSSASAIPNPGANFDNAIGKKRAARIQSAMEKNDAERKQFEKIQKPYREARKGGTFKQRPNATADDYKTIGVNPDDSDEKIGAKFRAEAKKAHADTSKDPAATEERMKTLNAAWKNVKPVDVKIKGNKQIKQEAKAKQKKEEFDLKLFCREFPEQCANKKHEIRAKKQHEKNAIMEREAVAKKRNQEIRRLEFLESRPGRAIMAYGAVYNETKSVSKQGAQNIGKILEIGPARQYAPVYRKTKKKPKRAPRRFRMRARGVVADVDMELGSIMNRKPPGSGW